MRRALVLAVPGLLALAGLVALAVQPGQAVPAAVQPGAVAGADLALPDPDLALVVGLARGPSVLGLPLGPAPGRVLAVPADAPAELGPLEPTGRTFAFTDPHGLAWEVAEYRAAWGFAYGAAPGPLAHDADAGAYNVVLLVDHTKVGAQVRLVAA